MKIIDWLESIEERFDRGINRDETVVFYHSYGFKDIDGQWKIEVRGIIFEPKVIGSRFRVHGSKVIRC